MECSFRKDKDNGTNIPNKKKNIFPYIRGDKKNEHSLASNPKASYLWTIKPKRSKIQVE